MDGVKPRCLLLGGVGDPGFLIETGVGMDAETLNLCGPPEPCKVVRIADQMSLTLRNVVPVAQ